MAPDLNEPATLVHLAGTAVEGGDHQRHTTDLRAQDLQSDQACAREGRTRPVSRQVRTHPQPQLGLAVREVCGEEPRQVMLLSGHDRPTGTSRRLRRADKSLTGQGRTASQCQHRVIPTETIFEYQRVAVV
jgi:hypothetical protein